MAQAALTRPMWLSACGKLPIISPLPESTSSASRPTSLMAATARSKDAVAASASPASACACASQNVQSRNVPSLPARPSRVRYRYTIPRSSVSRRAIASMVAFIRGQKPGNGQHQARRIEVLAAERLREGTRPLIPAAGKDGLPDLVTGGRPVSHAVFGTEIVGQGDRAVQRDPAHQLRIQEVPGLAADLPDPLVFLAPARSGGI